MSQPVSRKVFGATIGAGAGLTISNFALWIVDTIWWPSPDADIPVPVADFTTLIVTTGFAFLLGWLTKHDPNDVVVADPDV